MDGKSGGPGDTLVSATPHVSWTFAGPATYVVVELRTGLDVQQGVAFFRQHTWFVAGAVTEIDLPRGLLASGEYFALVVRVVRSDRDSPKDLDVPFGVAEAATPIFRTP